MRGSPVTNQESYFYSRYSTDMQRSESCEDQERGIRDGLKRKGIDAADAILLRDEAVSGTRADRENFSVLQESIRLNRVKLVAVYDLSRLSRAGDTKAFVTDLVYSGGRFISVSEGIDSDEPGWDIKVGVLDIHHSQTIANTSSKVRNGQMGRVLADDSAGDQPFGYESYYHDADWQQRLARRGPKPKKGLRIYEPEARWVGQIFAWFNAGWSIGAIAPEGRPIEGILA